MENWNLPSPPDILTFSKKTLTGGFYHTDEMRPTEGYRIFNTWMGDPSRVVLLEAMVNTIRQDGLLDNAKQIGEMLVGGMNQLVKEYPNQLDVARGFGCFDCVDVHEAAHRDKLVSCLREKGIQTGGNGERTLRLRPALIFQPKHAEIFLDTFNEVLHENK